MEQNIDIERVKIGRLPKRQKSEWQCSDFQGLSMVIFMTEWVDSDVPNWVGMLRFHQSLFKKATPFSDKLYEALSRVESREDEEFPIQQVFQEPGFLQRR